MADSLIKSPESAQDRCVVRSKCLLVGPKTNELAGARERAATGTPDRERRLASPAATGERPIRKLSGLFHEGRTLADLSAPGSLSMPIRVPPSRDDGLSGGYSLSGSDALRLRLLGARYGDAEYGSGVGV